MLSFPLKEYSSDLVCISYIITFIFLTNTDFVYKKTQGGVVYSPQDRKEKHSVFLLDRLQNVSHVATRTINQSVGSLIIMSPSNYVPFIHLFIRASLSHSISVSFCLSPEVEVGAAT